ncbi:hypothetical protein [Streptomyces sp. NPDC048516]|uniref:hypothetical protein n=1 Tax=Streptomyces sp. NPDC048516 TaxID=3365565 RepID=UPI0037128715
MAKIRVRGLGRLLLIVVTVVLALSLGTDAVYGEHAPAAPAANGVGRTAPSGTEPRASDTSTAENPESGSDRCPPRRDGRSTASVAAPTPPVTTVSTAGRGRTGGGLRLTVPLTGRQAVPLTRSGELPLRHAVFRC